MVAICRITYKLRSEASNEMVNNVKAANEGGFMFSDNTGLYLESISELTKQISEEDFKHVNNELIYLNSFYD